jgi:TonB-dependent starch-binding outer membrane protein SusC
MKTIRMLLVLAAAALIAPATASAQGGTVRGTVTEQGTGQPLQGAAVAIVGTNQTVVTNQEGRFVLTNVAAGQRTLRASRIGYAAQTRTVTIGAEPVEVSFALGTDVLGLDEVVVIGYGQTERRNTAGAISSLRPDDVVSSVPAPTIENVLQGRVSGVQVTQNSGVPGSAISVRVRGASSISAGNQPLYVVDGVPMIAGNFSGLDGLYGGQGVDALGDLNPNEIQSIEVLKDASAAAIYGSRASNGVVLITTKRGRAADRPEIRINAFTGEQRAWNRPGFLNTEQFIEVYNEGWQNYWNQRGVDYSWLNLFGYEDDAVPGLFTDDCDAAAPVCDYLEVPSGVNTDWVDEVLAPAPISNLFASIAGGNERARYFVSGNMLRQDGIVAAYGYERLNGRLNLDYSASDRLTLGTTVALTRSLTDRASGDNTIYGAFANSLASHPFDAVYNEDGDYNLTTFTYANPVALMNENRGQERGVRILGNAFANYSLLPGIDARVALGLDHFALRSGFFNSPIVGSATGSNGAGYLANSNANRIVTEGTLSWTRDFGAHNLSGVVGSSYEANDTETNFVQGVQFPTSQYRQLTSAGQITGGSANITENDLLSFFGRVSHNWSGQLTTTFNMRADGSSRFGANNRWGYFPSVAALWRVSDQPFFQNQNVFSDLAIRASYGFTGNQQGIGNFASLGLFSAGANYGDLPGIAPAQLPNPDLRWEQTAQLNLGGDVAVLDDRLSLAFDWYHKKTTDLLLTRPVPLSTGFAALTQNIGAMENRGIELAARAQLVRSARADGFNWTSELNLSRNRNKVTELFGDEPIVTGIGGAVIIKEGEALGAFYGYEMLGIFQSADEICRTAPGETAAQRNARCAAAGLAFQASLTAPGDVRFRDVNGDGVVNADDRTIIGSPWPDYVGGFTNTMTFAGLDLSVFLQFSQGNDVFNGIRFYSDDYGASFDNLSIRALDRWTPTNPSTTEPRAVYADPNSNSRTSSRFLEDGSYVRVKNATLGYTVPTRASGRMGFNSLRVYVQGQNLVTWTDYSGFDPEVNFAGNTDVTRGYDFYTLPQARTITVGVNVGL